MRKTFLTLAVGSFTTLVACGSAPSPFLGVWTVTAGTQTVICDTPNPPVTLSGKLTVIAGASSSNIVVQNTQGCDETFSTNNNTATATNQPCPTLQNGQAATLTYLSDSLNVNGNTLTETGNGTLSVPGADAGCVFTQALRATKN